MTEPGEPLFIYASWLRAKRSLLEIVFNEECLSPRDLVAKVDEWLKRHIFEFGQEYHISDRAMKQSSFDMVKEGRYRNARTLVDHLMQKGMFAEETTQSWLNGGETILTTRLLVCGAPKWVGPASRTKSGESNE